VCERERERERKKKKEKRDEKRMDVAKARRERAFWWVYGWWY